MSESDTNVESLRAEADALGIKVRADAKPETIRKRIDEHLAAEDAEEPAAEVAEEPVPEAAPQGEPEPVGRTRSWVNGAGKRKTTTVGSGLDRWYESSEHWKPA